MTTGLSDTPTLSTLSGSYESGLASSGTSIVPSGSRSMFSSITGTVASDSGSASSSTGTLASGSGSASSNTGTLASSSGSASSTIGTTASDDGAVQPSSSSSLGSGASHTTTNVPNSNPTIDLLHSTDQSDNSGAPPPTAPSGSSSVQQSTSGPEQASISFSIGAQPTPCHPLPSSGTFALSSGSVFSFGYEVPSGSATSDVAMCIGSITVSSSWAASGATSAPPGLSTSVFASSITNPASVGSSVQSLVGGAFGSLSPPTLTSTLNPTGVAASASASSLQVAIIYAQRAIQKYIDDPKDNKLQSEAENEINRAKDLSITLSSELPSPGGGVTKCGSGSGLLGLLQNVVSCLKDTLNNLVDDIKGGTDVVEKLKTDLSNLGTYVQPLTPNKPVPDPPEQDPNQTESQPSATQQHEEPSNTDARPSETSRPGSSETISSTAASTVTSTGSKGSSTFTTTSASESGSRSQYIVYAKQSADTNSLNNFLNSKVPSPSSVTFLQATGVIAFWGIPAEATDAATAGLNASEVNDIKQQAGVDDVVLNAALKPMSDPAMPTTTTSADSPSFVSLTVQPTDAPDIVAATDVAPPIDTAAPPEASISKAGKKRDLPRAHKSSTSMLSTATEALERPEPWSKGDAHHEGTLEKRMPPPYVVDIQRRANRRRTDGLDVPYELRAMSQPNFNPLPDLDQLDYV